MCPEKGRSCISVWSVVFTFVLAVVLVAVILPAVRLSRDTRSGWSTCCSNLEQIGKAIKTYMADWDDSYPTNIPDKVSKTPAVEVALGSGAINETTGKPITNKIGLAWVEELYSYMEPITQDKDDFNSVWKCPRAKHDQATALPGGVKNNPEVSYLFNYNVFGQKEDTIKMPADLMLCREGDRLYTSSARGYAGTRSAPSTAKDQIHPPQNTFMQHEDAAVMTTGSQMAIHGNGSNILFADSHVKLIGKSQMTGVTWDGKNKCWRNNADAAQMIRISP
jgi:prepilin-type processing-associated H-X9-DG protein